jgi:cellulose biosynthesis protein BcsQ
VVVIDTPPGDLDIIENCVLVADAVVIPVRTGFFDVAAVTPVVEMCRERGRPYSFLLTAVDSKMTKLMDAARPALIGQGPIFNTHLRYLQAYVASISRGKSAAEIDKSGSCQQEIDQLWAEVKRLAGAKSHE